MPGLPPSRARPTPLAAGAPAPGRRGRGQSRSVLRLPLRAPTSSTSLAAGAALGNALVLCPTAGHGRARSPSVSAGDGVPVAAHPRDWALGAAGATVVGTRAAAWAPVADLAAVVVLDEHDEALPAGAGAHLARPRRRHRAGPRGRACPASSPAPAPALEALALGAAADDRPGSRAGGLAGGRGGRSASERTHAAPGCSPTRWCASLRAGRTSAVRAEPHGPGPAAGLRGLRRAGTLRSLRRRCPPAR